MNLCLGISPFVTSTVYLVIYEDIFEYLSLWRCFISVLFYFDFQIYLYLHLHKYVFFTDFHDFVYRSSWTLTFMHTLTFESSFPGHVI